MLPVLARIRKPMSPPQRDDCLLKAENVSLNLNGRRILDQVSLSVLSGRITTIIGPNGAGKTSLLRVLLNLHSPTGGRVWRRPALRIGYMPQRVHIDEVLPLTVQRFLSLGGSFPASMLSDVLLKVGIGHLQKQPVQSISGGEMQRVLLARALLREPDLLVLDEPAQSVDVMGQGEMFQLIASLRDRHGFGVLMVSHELHLVMAAADSVICLNQHICCTGRPEMVSRDPAYLRLFGPAIPPGVAVYTHHHDHRHDLGGDVLAEGEGQDHG